MGVWRLEAFRRVLGPILSEILGPALATTFLAFLGYVYGSNGGKRSVVRGKEPLIL